MGEERFHARSASDRTDDWPFWFVADRAKAGLNVLTDGRYYGGKFDTRQHCESTAATMNKGVGN